MPNGKGKALAKGGVMRGAIGWLVLGSVIVLAWPESPPDRHRFGDGYAVFAGKIAAAKAVVRDRAQAEQSALRAGEGAEKERAAPFRTFVASEVMRFERDGVHMTLEYVDNGGWSGDYIGRAVQAFRDGAEWMQRDPENRLNFEGEFDIKPHATLLDKYGKEYPKQSLFRLRWKAADIRKMNVKNMTDLMIVSHARYYQHQALMNEKRLAWCNENKGLGLDVCR